jgi:type II secretory pathway component PulF
MAKAGLPLDQGLAALAREMGRGRLRQVTRQLADDLHRGSTLPEALERQRGRVPAYYAALLAAGVRSGRVGEVLGTLTLYARSLADFRSAVVTALVYPAVVFVLGILLLVFVGVTILPLFADIFDKTRMQLPWLTQAMLFVGAHAEAILLWPLVGLVAVLVTARWVLRSFAAGRVLWARFVYSLPLVGALIRSARLAAFTDLLGILVERSVPLPEALRLASAASSDPLLAEGGKQIEYDLSLGLPLGEALGQHGLVPELVIWMTRFAERQGTLGASLRHLAQMYRRQAELRAALLRTVLPPLLVILVAAVLVGLFVFGLLGPLYKLLGGISGGGL